MNCFCVCDGHEAPAVTVDIIVEKKGKILLIERNKEPFKGCWALPGGFIKCMETSEDAAIREAKEETGLDIKIEGLLGVYSNPERDPRGHVISICYVASGKGREKGGTDAAKACFFDFKAIKDLKLAFDHGNIIEDYKRQRNVLRKMWRIDNSKE
jgi:8-oxo-dGTP diphosphatase